MYVQGLLKQTPQRMHDDTMLLHSYLRQALPSGNSKKLQRKIKRKTTQAISDFAMIEDGDHIMVCMSGGKDSYSMLDILLRLREHAPINFTLTAVHLNQMQPGYPNGVMVQYLHSIGIKYQVIRKRYLFYCK